MGRVAEDPEHDISLDIPRSANIFLEDPFEGDKPTWQSLGKQNVKPKPTQILEVRYSGTRHLRSWVGVGCTGELTANSGMVTTEICNHPPQSPTGLIGFVLEVQLVLRYKATKHWVSGAPYYSSCTHILWQLRISS